MEFEENAPQQEGIIQEVSERPGKKYLQETPELQKKVDSKKIRDTYINKQIWTRCLK